MGEESGVPVEFFFITISSVQREKNVNEEEGAYIVCCSHLQESSGGEKEELQHIGIYTLLLQILTFEYKKSVGLSCL